MKNVRQLAVTSVIAVAFLPATSSFAQTTNAPQATVSLEEIVVTGRKREENLADVPVSISVFTADALNARGITTQDDLFAATPGLDYSNYNGDRTANNPGVRGVQSQLRASNQQKVASFVDGMPMIGNQGSVQFSGIKAVEVYRGPQSAAFGRSTFAGAINYVTEDATEEFTAKVLVDATDNGGQELGVLLSGPLTERLGYRVSYHKDDWAGPSEWTSVDGVEMASEETDNFNVKLNFELSDSVYGEVTVNRLETFDIGGASFIADPANCLAGSGIIRSTMGSMIELPSGTWDCDTNVPAGGVPRNHDVLGQFVGLYDANRLAYEASFGMGFAALDANNDGQLSSAEYLSQTLPDGQTYEQALLGQTMVPGNNNVRDSVRAELNFEIGDNVLQFLAMSTEDESQNWNSSDFNDSQASFNGMGTMLNPNVMSMGVNIDIEETYAEVRWVSPGNERFRYTLSGSYYDYSLQQQVYNNYGALFYGLTVPAGPNAGNPVNAAPGITISEVATNIGVAFGLQYDLTDRTTLSLEGRLQSDEVCGQDRNGANVEFCQETDAFLPRLAINTTISDTLSVYGQISVGNNPAGVNIAYQDAGNIQALSIANGSIPVPTGVGAINEGVIYDGAGGNPAPAVDFDENTFDTFEEELLTNFEIGAKGSYAGRRGSYTAALYFMKYEDIIGAENLNWDDVDPGGWNEGEWNLFTGERTWINQGDGETYGLEVTTDFAISDMWTVGGYATFSSAKYTDYCSIQAPEYSSGGNPVIPILTPAADGVLSSCGTVDGNWLPRQTPFTANFNATALLPNEFLGFSTSLRADIRHKGSFYEDHLNLTEREAVTMVNLSANMRSENWGVRLYVNNVTDNDEPSRIQPQRDFEQATVNTVSTIQSWLIVPARPREVGLQVQYTFR